MFPSFLDKPANIRFLEQNPDENIEILVRKHPFTNLSWIIFFVILFFLPFLIGVIGSSLGFGILSLIPAVIKIQVLILYYLLIIVFTVQNLLYWYFNVVMVTNQNIVKIEFFSLFSREVTEIGLKDIEGISTTLKGFLRESMDFGNIVIETATKEEAVKVIDVPHPDAFADRVRDLEKDRGILNKEI